MGIDYLYSDLTWTWEPSLESWARSYVGTGMAAMGEGGQITTSNIVVMTVVMYPSQYVEDVNGVHENLLALTGSGPLLVLRNGAVIHGTWRRPTLADTTELLDSAGQPIALNPGRTWVELVPTTVPVTLAP